MAKAPPRKRAVRFTSLMISRRAFAPLNKLLFRIATAGLGFGISENPADQKLFLRRLRRSLPKSPVMIDVGANTGQYASLVRQEIPEAQVISFEPHPTAFAELKRIPGIRAINMAVGDQLGPVQLFDYAGSPGSEHASLVPGVLEEIHHGTVAPITVDCTTLDSFLESIPDVHIDLLKIDVEGSELAVLNGAQRALAAGRIGVVQFEFNSMNTVSRTFIGDFIKALPGYRLHRLLRSGELLPISEEPPIRRELFGYQNIVAIKPQSRTKTQTGPPEIQG
jgi:FkbM family methyltransferase